MPGETNLGVLLKSMKPVLREGEFVFLTTRRSLLEVAPLEPLGLFHDSSSLVRRQTPPDCRTPPSSGW